MKIQQDIRGDILQLIMKIEVMFPELSKYMGEMPVKFSNSTSLTIETKNLISYHNSLSALLTNYARYHAVVRTKQPTLLPRNEKV